MWTLFIEVLTIRQSAREWDNGKIGKGSKQQQKEMTADDRKWQNVQEMTTWHNTRYFREVGNWNGGELVLGTW